MMSCVVAIALLVAIASEGSESTPCPDRCVGRLSATWEFPAGTRRASEPPGTTHTQGWTETTEYPGGAVEVVFESVSRGLVVHTILCTPHGSTEPVAICSSRAVVKTADVFRDGFESGDLSRWSTSVGSRLARRGGGNR